MIRPYRPSKQSVNQPRIGNILDPLGNDKKWTNVWGAVMNVPQPSGGAPVSPTPTPSVTPTNTTTPTQTVTPSITPSITPTSGECVLYELYAGGSGSNFTWINCDGTPGSIYLSGSSSTQLCGKYGTFSYDGGGLVAFIGPCPSPTPTPTNTTTPTVTSSVTPSITPTNTATPTVTPTITPSSSPLPVGWVEANLYLSAVDNAGGVLNSTISGATRTLFNSLVTSGIYSKLDFMYPIIGGNSNGHKFNAINPLDTNGANRLTFFGGWTHSSTGMQGNGINAYADTYYQPVTEAFMSDSSASIGVYVRDLSASSYPIEMGATYYSNGCSLSVKMDSATNIIGNLFDGLTETNFASSAQTGDFIITKTASASVRVYRRGVLATTLSIGGSVAPSSGNLYVGAGNDTRIPVADNFSPRELAFVFGGQGLTATEATNISTYINTFQTTLGRNTY